MTRKQLKLAIIGFGNAAQEFAKLLLEKDRELREKYNVEVIITAIAGNRKGTLINEAGIDLEAVLSRLKTHNRFENPLNINTFEMLEKSGADVAVELSPLSIKDGQPAIDHIKTAFAKSMHVITANKGPIAWAFAELNSIAESRGLKFLYETTVMDGSPVFCLGKYGLPGCEILSFEGILNTTTNFILAEMEKGNSFDSAVSEAQRRGFAEADPSMDIMGMDAAAKTCAIINALMGGGISPDMIEVQGIEDITVDDLIRAREKSGTIKLLCKGFRDGREVKGTVKPEFVSFSHPFASVLGTSSALTLETDLMGKITMFEHDPEIQQTAYGIYSDLMRVICG